MGGPHPADTHHQERGEEIAALCLQSGVGIFVGPVTQREKEVHVEEEREEETQR